MHEELQVWNIISLYSRISVSLPNFVSFIITDFLKECIIMQ